MGNSPSPSPSLNIIGAGRVGKTLARLWQDQGTFTIGSILNCSTDSSHSAVSFIGAGTVAVSFSDLKPASFYMIAVTDNQIEDCATALAVSRKVQSGDIVFHCSGALSSDYLTPLREQGAKIASFHPLNSFTIPATSIYTFAGTFCVLEGDKEAVEILTKAAKAIGGKPETIKNDTKLLYHASAVFACNYVTTLIEAALRSADAAGISRDRAKEMLRPLINETIKNNLEGDPATALTGPIARGDMDLVEKQHQSLTGWNKDIADLYENLAKATVALLRENKA